MGTQLSRQDPSSQHRSRLLYEACLNDDLKTVETLLPTLTSEEINRVNSETGQTALHAACSSNNAAIVRLLLQNSFVFRTITNRQGQIAFEELPAASEDIQLLFARPQGDNKSPSRFLDTASPSIVYQIKQRIGDNLHQDYQYISAPNDWLCGYENGASDATESQFMNSIARAPSFLKYLLKQRTEREGRENLDDLLGRSLDRHSHKEALRLYDDFIKKSRVDPLLTLYTLETPLYGVLQTNANAYTALLFLHLSELSERAFTGRAYRGGSMTSQDIDAYRWAAQPQRDDFVLETRTIQSTSKKKSVAQNFANIGMNRTGTVRFPVLLTFHFPTKCPTAINLTRINDQLPPLSSFTGEEEVLLLPFTLFKVNSIETDTDTETRQYFINLTNAPVPETSLLSSWSKVKK
ncbi:unnamed protein product [Rotaria sp. Silwood2]|nr:unnamed protein product [Rotaria sp. Silwood2]CAF4604708.1 unnamed protein product [Rotaria sp. Silwood2]